MKKIITIQLILFYSGILFGQISSIDSTTFVNSSNSYFEQILINDTIKTNGDPSCDGQYLLIGKNTWTQYGTWKYKNRKGEIKLETFSPNDTIGTRYVNQWMPNKNQILKNGQGRYYQIGMIRITDFGPDSTVYEIRDSLKNGTYISWCPLADNEYYKCETGQYINNKKQSLTTLFYPNGKILSIYNGEDYTRLKGEYHEFFDNGQYSEYGYYENFRKSGVWKYWAKNGVLIKECNYDSGKLRGQYKEFHENGSIKISGNYEFSSGQDTIRKYDPETYEQTITIKETTTKSYKHGLWKFYDINGIAIKTEMYEFGELKQRG